MNRPKTTLFMLMSVDGKISTGDRDALDFDKDLPKIPGVAEGLHQYYDIERRTDIYSLNTGRVFAKIGLNERKAFKNFVPVHFVIIDNKPHLTKKGLLHLASKCRGIYLATTNKNHPALQLAKQISNLTIFSYTKKVNFVDLFEKIYVAGCKKLTIQSGGTLNAEFIRAGLIDRLSIVVAPVIVGGKDTSTLIDGESLHSIKELSKIKPLKLISAKKLKNSYLHLIYAVESKS